MPRDYKHRANQSKKKPLPTKVVWWKWGAVIILLGLFAFFLIFLRKSASQLEKQTVPVASTPKKNQIQQKPKHQNKAQEEPHFDFYTILPKAEVIVPDHELNTRNREEQLGKEKTSQYLIQAGSFREFEEADKLRARLALMGIESSVEKAKVGNVIWNRVKIGPYTRSSSIAVIRKRLRNNNIDAIVTEIKS